MLFFFLFLRLVVPPFQRSAPNPPSPRPLPSGRLLPGLLGGGAVPGGGRRRRPLLPHAGASAAAAQDGAARPGLRHQQGRRRRGGGQSARSEAPPGGQAAVAPPSPGVRLGGVPLHLQAGFTNSLCCVFLAVQPCDLIGS